MTKQTGIVNFTFAYTWSKALGIISNPINSLFRDDNYGVLGFNRPHIVAGSYVVNVPDLGRTVTGKADYPAARARLLEWLTAA